MIRKIIIGIGIFVFLYGSAALGLSFVYTDMKVTIDWYKQVFICMGGGLLLMTVSGYSDKVYSIILGLLPKKENKVVEETKKDVSPEKVLVNDSWSQLEANYDFLTNLTAQLTEDADKKMCMDLQHRLLELHHLKITTKK